MSNGRARPAARRLTVAVSLTALTAVTFTPTSSHADPEPTIEEVEERVAALYQESARAQERLNTVRVEMKDKRRRLVSLREDLQQQRRTFTRVRREAAALVAYRAQRPGASLGAATELIVSDDPTAFLDGMVAMETFSGHQSDLLDSLDQAARRLDRRRGQVDEQLTELATDRRQIADEQATVEDNLDDAQALLDRLEAEERARLRRIQRARERAEQRALEAAQIAEQQASPSRAAPAPTETDTPTTGTSTTASGSGAAAVAFAMAQVGDSYVYGATGPDAWDCSGLTMGAWAAAGVSLPHASSAQYSSGTPVSASELQPGDLVFYYSPISHVGLYIGNGQIVHASNPSSPVGTASLYSMPFAGAVRPG